MPLASKGGETRWKQRVRVFEFVYMCLINGLEGKEVARTAFEDYVFDSEETALIDCYAAEGAAFATLLSSRLTPEWTWERIPPVDKAIMLVALCESKAWSTPKSVAIDQAVTTAKHYGDDDDYKFINGVLEKVLG